MIVDPAPSPGAVSDSGAAVTSVDKTELASVSDVGDLIGDVTSWPSLSESTRPSPKSPSPSPPSDPPIAAASPYAPELSQSLPNHRQPDTDSTPNTNPNRQRSSGRGGSSRGGSSRGVFIRHPPPPQQLPLPPPLPPAFYGGFEGPMRGPFFYNNGFGAHPRPTDHQFSQPRGGPRPRGDGGRRFNYRGPPMGYQMPPQHGPPMGYPMPPPQVVPFPFMHPSVLPEPFMGIPPYTGGARAPVPPPSLSPLPTDLQVKLLSQINYYFSDENLVKDMYLRSQMDDGGWVPVALIAKFNKVRELTQDIQLILETMGSSAIVEVQGDKLRRRNDWRRWIPSGPVLEEPTTNGLNTIIRCLQNATLEEVHAADWSGSSATNASSSPRVVLT